MTDVPLAYQERLNIRENTASSMPSRASWQPKAGNSTVIGGSCQRRCSGPSLQVRSRGCLRSHTFLGFIHETRGLACEGRALGGSRKCRLPSVAGQGA
jgi:hypothetical protein